MLKNKSILIVDDDVLFRELLEQCVEKRGYEAYKAPDVSHAKQMIPMILPSIVITDIRMPGESGVDLLKWIKGSYPETVVIVMTGFSDLLDAVGASEAGAVGFLPKPFHQNDLLAILNTLNGNSSVHSPQGTLPAASGSAIPPIEISVKIQQAPQAPVEPISQDESDYMKVLIDDFVSGSQIQYSIFLRILKQGKPQFLKIAHCGEDLSIERIRAYREKGLHFLHLRKEDFARYVGLAQTIAKVAVERNLVSEEKTTNLVRHALETIEQNFLDSGISKPMYEQATGMIETSIRLFTQDDSGLTLLESLKNTSDELYAHCSAVSLISVMIAKGMGWSSTRSISRVAMAGLLHDIGKKQLAPELRSKARSLMSFEEVADYETHPQRGMDILSALEFVPQDVIQAVHQHHERLNGTGFPNHVFESKIIPMAKIIAVADEFCHVYMSKSERDPKKVYWALEKFLMHNSEGLSPTEMIALYAALNIKPPEKLKPRIVAA